MISGLETILMVEDEFSLRRLCKRLLKSFKYSVSSAAKGGKVLLLVEEKKLRPDLVITDVFMPEIGGEVLVGRLKNITRFKSSLYVRVY